MGNDKEVCGTCKWNAYDEGEYICNNLKSELCGDYTEYNDTCDFWEDKE